MQRSFTDYVCTRTYTCATCMYITREQSAELVGAIQPVYHFGKKMTIVCFYRKNICAWLMIELVLLLYVYKRRGRTQSP